LAKQINHKQNEQSVQVVQATMKAVPMQQISAPHMSRLTQAVMLAALAIGSGFVASKAVAQTPPTAGQVQRELSAPAPSLPKADPVLPKAQEVRPQLRPASNFSMTLNGVRFSGNTQIMETDLQLLVIESLGKKLDFNGLQSLADSVSNFYRGKGFFVARAYLPQQEIKDGIVEIALLEGRVGQATVKQEGSVRTAASVAQGFLDANVPVGSIVQEKALERAALLANDLPGIDASISLDPGAQTGDTNVTLTTNEGQLFSATVDLDNHGNRFTGQYRLGATLGLNSPFGLGDQVTLRLMTTDEKLAMVRSSYSLPVGNNGGRIGLAASRVVFEVCCQAAGFSPSGDSTQLTAFGTYPLERQRDRSIFLTANYDNKQQRNRSGVGIIGERELDVITFGSSLQSRDSAGGGGINFANLSLGLGHLEIKDALGQTADAASSRAAGNFAKLGLQASRIQRLSSLFSVYGGVNAQWANKNLDSAEKFALGGATGVRGYPSGEASGDEGYVAQVELRADLPVGGATQWQSFLFYDHGGIKVNNTVFIAGGLTPNSYSLNSWGVGLNISRAGTFQIRALWAKKVGNNPGASAPNFNDVDGRKGRERLWFQAVTQF
jgi:hemolysin activation/secretion protein